MEEDSEKNLEIRPAARTVLLDSEGRVAIMNVVGEGYYKIPGGSLENEEDSQEAARREAEEEAGCQCEILVCLGEITTKLSNWNMLDVSEGFLANIIQKNSPKLEDHEIERDFQLEWHTSLDEAIKVIENVDGTVLRPELAAIQARDLEYLRRAKRYLAGEFLSKNTKNIVKKVSAGGVVYHKGKYLVIKWGSEKTTDNFYKIHYRY